MKVKENERIEKNKEEKIEKDENRSINNGRWHFWVSVVITLFKLIFTVYDVISYIPMQLYCNPSNVLEKSRKTKAVPAVEGDSKSPWHKLDIDRNLKKNEIFPGCNTIGKIWDECVRRYSNFDCLGTREVLSLGEEIQNDGRKFKKMMLGKYRWLTYEEVNQKVNTIARGLLDIGHVSKENAAIFAETCAEWMMFAMACFKCNFPVTTVYATLGEEAVLYALKESSAATIFVSSVNAPKIAKIVADCEHVRTVICFASQESLGDDEPPQQLKNSQIRVLSFSELLRFGERTAITVKDTVQMDDLAVIMYTSGTTGNPKGVLLTHRNIISAVSGQMEAAQLRQGDIGIGYLPLAHIMEICTEINVFVKGLKLGYSSPQTLLDHSTKLKKGQIGDCRELKPTVIACVPTVMNRMYKEVMDQVYQSSLLAQELFKVCYERKRRKWTKGYSTPVLDRLVFSKVREILGGRVRLIISGSAPLSAETQLFMTLCFCCRVSQGYGLTETTGAGTLADVNDRSTNTVGPPVSCCEIMLREWKEGGYVPSSEKPEGEILIGGDCVSLGYLNNPEKTKEDFFEFDGKRWFATGDIGKFRKDGSLVIIDRKKDLVKLSRGEYISLGKVESVISTHPIIDNICVYAGFNQDHVVALVVPNFRNLQNLAKKVGIEESNKEILCSSEMVRQELLTEIQHFCKGRLLRTEIPQNIYICQEVWTPAMDLVTEAMKLKRKNIEKKYKKEIDAMYEW